MTDAPKIRKKLNSVWKSTRRFGIKIADSRWTKHHGKWRLVTDQVNESDFINRATHEPHGFFRGALCSARLH